MQRPMTAPEFGGKGLACVTVVNPGNRLRLLGSAAGHEAVREYVEHDETERNHQGIGNVIPLPGPKPAASPNAPVIRRERLGGLLRYDQREAG